MAGEGYGIKQFAMDQYAFLHIPAATPAVPHRFANRVLVGT
jgi:hypothetical protein